MAFKNIRAPFVNGSLMHYAEGADLEWRDDPSFTAVLYMDGIRRGRSAAYFVWRDGGAHEYPMFMKDLEDLVQRSTIWRSQTVMTDWIVVKRGTNYGIRMAEDK